MGHEFVGTVTEAGPAVKSVQVGDKIVSPFTVSWYSLLSLVSQSPFLVTSLLSPFLSPFLRDK